MLDASLGYYINPLLNVILGMFFLGERLRPLQWLAVALAACGVAVQLIQFGSLPLIALALAASFGLYGLLRKKINLDAGTGLFMETCILLPLASIYVLLIADSPTADWAANPASTNLLLIAAGVVTTVPPALLHRCRHQIKTINARVLSVYRPKPDVPAGNYGLR